MDGPDSITRYRSPYSAASDTAGFRAKVSSHATLHGHGRGWGRGERAAWATISASVRRSVAAFSCAAPQSCAPSRYSASLSWRSHTNVWAWRLPRKHTHSTTWAFQDDPVQIEFAEFRCFAFRGGIPFPLLHPQTGAGSGERLLRLPVQIDVRPGRVFGRPLQRVRVHIRLVRRRDGQVPQRAPPLGVGRPPVAGEAQAIVKERLDRAKRGPAVKLGRSVVVMGPIRVFLPRDHKAGNGQGGRSSSAAQFHGAVVLHPSALLGSLTDGGGNESAGDHRVRPNVDESLPLRLGGQG